MPTTSKLKGVSFEFFPPVTPEGQQKLCSICSDLGQWEPDFFSVTYGAGGGVRQHTLQTVNLLQEKTGLIGVPHLSCIGVSKEKIIRVLHKYQSSGISQIVALRGDLPSGHAMMGELRHAADLVGLIRRETGDAFRIHVAAHPEVHPQSANADQDIENFCDKMKAGADSAITQYFYNADAYFYFRDQCTKRGMDRPIIPGIMPITNYTKLRHFSSVCGAEIPQWLDRRLVGMGKEADKEDLFAFGLDVVAELCQRLLDNGAPGLHFYTLNTHRATETLCRRLSGTA